MCCWSPGAAGFVLPPMLEEALDVVPPPQHEKPPNPLSRGCSRVSAGFRSLRGSPPELWKAYVLNFLESYSYFSFGMILTLFLSEDFGYGDKAAGTIYGGSGALLAIFGVITGPLVDWFGVATSLRVGFVVSLVARTVIFATTSRPALLTGILFLLPLGGCFSMPVLVIGIRRYTDERKNRGFAFGILYVVRNLAALITGPAVDLSTKLVGGDGDRKAWFLSGYRVVILTGMAANIVALALTLTVREIKLRVTTDADMGYSGEVEDEEHEGGRPRTGPGAGGVSTFRPRESSQREHLTELLRSTNFLRFFAVCCILVNVQMTSRLVDATMPKFMVREFGANTPYGTIFSINPLVVCVLVPTVTAVTSKVDPLIMVHIGTYVSSASRFVLVASTSIWACVIFVTMTSVGEVIWSPRLYDYSMSMAKEGREGTYTALSNLPDFLAKLPAGFMSGYLLDRFCPKEGPRNSSTMWLIVGLTGVTSPIMLTVFWRCLSNREDDDESRCTSPSDELTGDLSVALLKEEEQQQDVDAFKDEDVVIRDVLCQDHE